MRLIAPILSFTADEIWQSLNLSAEATVFEDVWYELPESNLEISRADWDIVITARRHANRALEIKREDNLVGSSLQAELEIKAPAKIFSVLSQFKDDLKFIFIVSNINITQVEDNFDVEVKPSNHTKCERCWHYRSDVGSNAEHPTICGRCVSNLFGAGEKRKYA